MINKIRCEFNLCIIVEPEGAGYTFVLKKAFRPSDVSGGTIIYKSSRHWELYEEAEQAGIEKAQFVLDHCNMDQSIMDIKELIAYYEKC